MSKYLELGGRFPYVRLHALPPLPEPEPIPDLPQPPVPSRLEGHWVVLLKDRRVAVIDHAKTDGRYGVRPVSPAGKFYPNTAEHWSMKHRYAIPEELAVSAEDFRKAESHEIPETVK